MTTSTYDIIKSKMMNKSIIIIGNCRKTKSLKQKTGECSVQLGMWCYGSSGGEQLHESIQRWGRVSSAFWVYGSKKHSTG
jgi:Uri superfamily endonuclease